jgi:hypothetical protein
MSSKIQEYLNSLRDKLERYSIVNETFKDSSAGRSSLQTTINRFKTTTLVSITYEEIVNDNPSEYLKRKLLTLKQPVLLTYVEEGKLGSQNLYLNRDSKLPAGSTSDYFQSKNPELDLTIIKIDDNPDEWLITRKQVSIIQLDRGWFDSLTKLIEDIYLIDKQVICNIPYSKLIGSGVNGEVFQLTEGNKVLKIYKSGTAGTRSFYTEVDITSRLIHPNIMGNSGILVPGENCNSYGIIMDLAVETLTTKISDPQGYKIYPTDRRIRDIYELFSALSFLHSECIVHGDLRSDNILVAGDPRESLRIIDFGISQYIAPGKYYDAGYKDYYYRDREFDGKFHDFASDVLNLGIVCLSIITGEQITKTSKINPDFYKVGPPAAVAAKIQAYINDFKAQSGTGTDQLTGLVQLFTLILRPADGRATAQQILSLPLFSEFKKIEGKVNRAPQIVSGPGLEPPISVTLEFKDDESKSREAGINRLALYFYTRMMDLKLDYYHVNKYIAAIILASKLLDSQVQIISKLPIYVALHNSGRIINEFISKSEGKLFDCSFIK